MSYQECSKCHHVLDPNQSLIDGVCEGCAEAAENADGPSRAAALLARHQADTGLEGDNEIILIHLLGDIIEWCDANHVDFDATVEETREMLRDAAT